MIKMDKGHDSAKAASRDPTDLSRKEKNLMHV